MVWVPEFATQCPCLPKFLLALIFWLLGHRLDRWFYFLGPPVVSTSLFDQSEVYYSLISIFSHTWCKSV
jgi:hypothetical protein